VTLSLSSPFDFPSSFSFPLNHLIHQYAQPYPHLGLDVREKREPHRRFALWSH
jgi:hypothetical protein